MLTKTEKIILLQAVQNGANPETAEAIYLSYRAGEPIRPNAPQWEQDLWREAQERKQYHLHQTG